ncbi:MAG TPA: hypothetical protein VF288_12005 [Mycobacteriales bacterium]
MTVDIDRAERLRAAVEAMPPGPSRARFAALAASLGRSVAAPAGSLDGPGATDERAAAPSEPAGAADAPPPIDPPAPREVIGRPAVEAVPRRLLPLDDDVLPDEDVLPATDSADDEVPIGQWRTWAPPPRQPAAVPAGTNEDAAAPAAVRPVVELSADLRENDDVGGRPAVVRIPADRPPPANEPVDQPVRRRRWGRRRPS